MSRMILLWAARDGICRTREPLHKCRGDQTASSLHIAACSCVAMDVGQPPAVDMLRSSDATAKSSLVMVRCWAIAAIEPSLSP